MEQKTIEVLANTPKLVRRKSGSYYMQPVFYLTNGQKTKPKTFSSSELTENKARIDIEKKIDGFVEQGLHLELGGLNNTENPLFRDFYKVWYKSQFDRTYENHRTREEVQYKLNYLLKELGNTPLKDFDHQFIEENIYFKIRDYDVRTGNKRKNPLKWATIKKYLIILDKIFKHAKTLQILLYNPISNYLDDIPSAEKKTTDDEEITVFEGNQIDIIIEEAFKVNYQWGLFVLLALSTGMRRGELIALDINTSFNMYEKKVIINKSISSSKSERLKVGKTKNKRDRDIYFDDSLKRLLQKQIDLREQHIVDNRENLTWFETKPLFLPETRSKSGEPYSPHSISQKWSNFINMIHQKYPFIPVYNFHALRHTFATRLLNKGLSMEEVSFALGHSEISITQRRYAKLDKDRTKPVPNYLNYNLPEGV